VHALQTQRIPATLQRAHQHCYKKGILLAHHTCAFRKVRSWLMLMRCCSRMLTSSLAVRPPRTGPQELWHVLPARSTVCAMPVKAVHVRPTPRALFHQQGTAAQPSVCVCDSHWHSDAAASAWSRLAPATQKPSTVKLKQVHPGLEMCQGVSFRRETSGREYVRFRQ